MLMMLTLHGPRAGRCHAKTGWGPPRRRWAHDWLYYLAIIGGLTPLEPIEIGIMLVLYFILGWLVLLGACQQGARLYAFLRSSLAASASAGPGAGAAFASLPRVRVNGAA